MKPAEVVLDVELIDGGFYLVLVNIGDGVAHDVSVVFEPELIGADTMVVSALPLWKRLRMLRPDREMRVFFDTMHAVFARPRGQQQFRAVVKWKLAPRKVEGRTYQHDLGAFRGLPDVR